ncbi:prestin-like [Ptychodera flava]|uniref:prestin-like n=1 Tax=Ptychodera flava TaxID=63121 RepID=UPI003969DBCC
MEDKIVDHIDSDSFTMHQCGKMNSAFEDISVYGSLDPLQEHKGSQTGTMLKSGEEKDALVASKEIRDANPLSGDSSQDGAPLKSFRIERPIYTQQSFQSVYKESPSEHISYIQRFVRKFKKCQCSGQCCTGCVTSTLPIIKWLPNYGVRKQLPGDIISGITVCAMNIPQGMAYALLASVPPVYGLYLSFFAPIVYALTGSAREIAVGTFAVISMMVSSAIERAVPQQASSDLNPSDIMNGTSGNTTAIPGTSGREGELVLAAVSLAFLVGLIQLSMYILRLGWVTIYLSDPFIRGYTTGAAIHVFTSQVDDLLGIDIPRYSGVFKLIYVYRDIVLNLKYSNYVTILLSISCITVLIIIKLIEGKFSKQLRGYPLGAELIVVILGALASHLIGLEDYGVDIIGDIPTGLPAPKLPSTTYMGSLVTDAIAIAIVVFAISVSMAALFGQKNNYKVDANQELVAYGCTNTITSFFSCYPSSCSLSRSLVQENSGGSSQIAGLVNSVLMLVILLFLAPLFEPLPKAVLASVIVVALKGMFKQFMDLKKLWKYDKIDFNVWWVTCLGVFLFDVDLGLMIGVGFSIFVMIWRTQEPYCCLLGRIPGTDIYKDITHVPSAKEIPGIKIFRMMSSLYYANVDHFKKSLHKLTKINPRKILQARAQRAFLKEMEEKKRQKEDKVNGNICQKSEQDSDIDRKIEEEELGGIHAIILDCSSLNFVDSSGLTRLIQIINAYKKIGVKILMAQVKKRVRDTISKSEFYSQVNLDGQSLLFVTIHDAVLYVVKESDLNELLVDDTDGRARTHIHTVIEGQRVPPDVNAIRVNETEQDTAF